MLLTSFKCLGDTILFSRKIGCYFNFLVALKKILKCSQNSIRSILHTTRDESEWFQVETRCRTRFVRVATVLDLFSHNIFFMTHNVKISCITCKEVDQKSPCLKTQLRMRTNGLFSPSSENFLLRPLYLTFQGMKVSYKSRPVTVEVSSFNDSFSPVYSDARFKAKDFKTRPCLQKLF